MTRPAFLLVAVTLVLALAPSAALSTPAHPAALPSLPSPMAVYASHAPILIDGDANFTAANGVTGGSGTAADPYIIEGWDINGSGQEYPSPLQLRDTRAEFAIRNVSIHDFSGSLLFLGGIDLENVSNGRIENVSFGNGTFGLSLNGVADVVVANGSFAWNEYDVYGRSVANTTFQGNQFQGFFLLEHSHDVVIQQNHFTFYIQLEECLRISILANSEIAEGVYVGGTTVAEYASHTITPDNLANGLPIRYYANCAGLVVDGVPASQVIVANCTGVRVSNLTMQGWWAGGILLAFVSHANVTGNHLNGTDGGIRVSQSSDIHVDRNSVTDSFSSGIEVDDTGFAVVQDNLLTVFLGGMRVDRCPNATIVGNDVARSPAFHWVFGSPPPTTGIVLQSSPGAFVASNRLRNLSYGIGAYDSDRMTFRGNEFTDGIVGLELVSTPNATVQANLFHGAGLRIPGYYPGPNSFDLDVSVSPDNLVNGLPLLYYHGCSGLDLNGTVAGQVIVADCSDVHIQRLNISGLAFGITLNLVEGAVIEDSVVSGTGFSAIDVEWSSNVTLVSNRVVNGILASGTSSLTLERNEVSSGDYGILVAGFTHVVVSGNVVSGTGWGIGLAYMSNATVTENEITSNDLGLSILGVDHALIYHNNFVNNTVAAQQAYSTNVSWDNGYPSGGNYWSEYNGTDRCSGPNQTACDGGDGIGDTPYVINATVIGAVDRYPLMAPYPAPPASSSLSQYLILGIAWGIGGAVAVGVYLAWRYRRRSARTPPPAEQPDTTHANGR